MIKNLLPEDTRLAEFIGSISLMFMGIFLGSHAIVNMELLFIQRTEFWHVLFIMLGFTQFLSLVFYPQLELLRCIMSLFTGATLIWLSFLSLVNIMEISEDFKLILEEINETAYSPPLARQLFSNMN